MSVTIDALRNIFAKGLPLVAEMGITLEGMDAGEALMRMPYNADWIGDPRTGVLHGGAVSILLDTTSGAAVFAHPKNGGRTATIDLRINYMRPARPQMPLMARAKVFHVTRTVAFVGGAAWDADEANPVATAQGAFTFQRKEDAA